MVLQAVEMTRDALEATVGLNRLAWHGLQLEEPATSASSAGSDSKAQVPEHVTSRWHMHWASPMHFILSVLQPLKAAEAQSMGCLQVLGDVIIDVKPHAPVPQLPADVRRTRVLQVLRKALSVIKRMTAQKQVTSVIARQVMRITGHESCPCRLLTVHTLLRDLHARA
jgi:hypothetical protein